MTERVLLKLPENQDLPALRVRLESAFGKRANITDYTQTNPSLTRALDRSTRFLSMVSLIALIVGGLGVGATMQSHLRQKMTNIAFMKCIGGRSEHILYIYLAQALWLGILGSVFGAILGAFAQSVFARLIADYFDVQVTLIWPVAAMLQGIVAGLATTALFSLPALLAIRSSAQRHCCRDPSPGNPRQHGTRQVDRGRGGHCGPLGYRSVGQRITALCDRVRRKPRCRHLHPRFNRRVALACDETAVQS